MLKDTMNLELKMKINTLSKELEKVLNSIKEYNESDLIDGNLERYLSNRQFELTKELKNFSFGSNVELLH